MRKLFFRGIVDISDRVQYATDHHYTNSNDTKSSSIWESENLSVEWTEKMKLTENWRPETEADFSFGFLPRNALFLSKALEENKERCVCVCMCIH